MPPEPRRGGIGAAVAAAERRARRSLLRNHGGGHAPVSNLELFFDLVFVFAITQLSGFLHHRLDPLGLAEGLMLFLALWWGWIHTTWVANWLKPDRLPVRLSLMALMLLSLAMAVALPKAFADKALPFAGAYVALQLGRSLVTAWFFRIEKASNALNMLRISLWFLATAPLWIGGALAGGSVQLICWGLALAIEYAGPFALYRVPGLGRSSPSDWNISGSHMAERCALFIIIALGEGIVVIGTSFSGLSMEAGRIGAFAIAFMSSALMWWLYFDLGAERGARMITGHAQVGRVARNAFTYLHMPIVLGIVICAVADALMLEQWDVTASQTFVAVQCGGILLFLIGVGVFKRASATIGNFPFSHTIAMLQVGLLIAWHAVWPFTTAGMSRACALVLFITAVWEWVSFHGGWLERMEKRGWAIARPMRARIERRRAEREAQSG